MKIKALLATLIGAVAINGATAGEWCPPAPDKCPVECCPETAGSLSFGYDTDYIWKGVRFARDFIWADVNYTFDIPCLPVSPTIGVWHGTDLSSTINYGDETNLYAGVALPEVMGLEAELLYTMYLFPTTRQPSPGTVGDSFHSIGISASKELFCGVSAEFGSEYYFGGDVAGAGDLSAWYHHAGLGYTMDVTDCIGVELSAGVAYSDGLWSGLGGGNVGSGWNHYYVKAGVPITIGCNATLTPYVGYNGTPDGWKAGNVNAIQGANSQDAFHGGVSISVGF
ncbi:MAG: hypothetical protein P1U89_02715 [Verrucomicrobiales bacterium]|nr:hypothetical protein [Verrucomicrobiales bacterium]